MVSYALVYIKVWRQKQNLKIHANQEDFRDLVLPADTFLLNLVNYWARAAVNRLSQQVKYDAAHEIVLLEEQDLIHFGVYVQVVLHVPFYFISATQSNRWKALVICIIGFDPKQTTNNCTVISKCPIHRLSMQLSFRRKETYDK